MAITERQQGILGAVLHEHIKSAKPVGSETLAESAHLGLSAASIRNALQELEEEGFLTQPHTSAGRIPTVKAYRFYLDHLLEEVELSRHAQDELRTALAAHHVAEARLKMVARTLAGLCTNTVIIGFSRHDTYYTGLAHLFHQPEFAAIEHVLSVSEIVDRLDEVIAHLFDDIHADPVVLIGRDNPFGEATGAVVMRCKDNHLMGILGPVRMPYGRNLALLNFTRQLLQA